MSSMRIICIGGGAASFFFAAQASERLADADITILEQGKKVLIALDPKNLSRINPEENMFY